MISDILQAKKLIFLFFAVIQILFRYTKINDLYLILVWSGAGVGAIKEKWPAPESELRKFSKTLLRSDSDPEEYCRM